MEEAGVRGDLVVKYISMSLLVARLHSYDLVLYQNLPSLSKLARRSNEEVHLFV